MNFLSCRTGSAVERQYQTRMLIGAGLCVVGALVAAFTFRTWHLTGVPAYPVASLPAWPILWALVETGRYLARETDEFQRNMLVQCLLAGIGGTLGVTTVWGYLEDFARAPRLDLIWVYPIFWLFAGIAMPVVRARYR